MLKFGKYILNRAGSRGVVYGGALQAQNLNQAAQAVSGVEYEWRGRPIGGGFGGPPQKKNLKSMSLRMHFKPF